MTTTPEPRPTATPYDVPAIMAGLYGDGIIGPETVRKTESYLGLKRSGLSFFSSAKLAKAKAAVVAGQKALDAKKRMAGAVVRDQYQQQTNLLPVAMMVSDNGMTDLQTRLQWSTTMFDTTAATIDPHSNA